MVKSTFSVRVKRGNNYNQGSILSFGQAVLMIVFTC